MQIVTIPVDQVDEFYFYMHYPIKAWLFEKIIFELTACFCHVTYAFQSESTLCSCLNVKELLARSRREI